MKGSIFEISTVAIKEVAAPQRHRSLTPTCDFATLNPLVTGGLNEVNATLTCQLGGKLGAPPQTPSLSVITYFDLMPLTIISNAAYTEKKLFQINSIKLWFRTDS